MGGDNGSSMSPALTPVPPSAASTKNGTSEPTDAPMERRGTSP